MVRIIQSFVDRERKEKLTYFISNRSNDPTLNVLKISRILGLGLLVSSRPQCWLLLHLLRQHIATACVAFHEVVVPVQVRY